MLLAFELPLRRSDMLQTTPPFQNLDVTRLDTLGELLRVFDYLWPAPPPTVTTPRPQVERRVERRYWQSALSRLSHARVHPGIDVRLLDLSSSGARFESRTRFSPRMPIRLILGIKEAAEIEGDGLVLRCCVHEISAKHVLYRSAIRFFTPIPISEVIA